MAMHFEGGFTRNYTTTITQALGPTTSSARVALPQPAPTDLNVIWLAKNGNDANPGTSGSPKLTLLSAVGALTAGKPTIHIFRNGYVGDLAFTEPTTVNLPANRNIQVEIGETASITFTTNTLNILSSGTCKLNGLFIIKTDQGAADIPNPVLAQAGTILFLDNCQLISTAQNMLGAVRLSSTATSVTLNSSIIGQISQSGTSTNTTITINNSLIKNDYTKQGIPTPLLQNGACILVAPNLGSTMTINANNSYLISNSLPITNSSNSLSYNIGIIHLGNSGATGANTVNFNPTSCYIIGNGAMLTVNNTVAGYTFTYNNNFNYTKRDILISNENIGTALANIIQTVTETNQIDTNTPLLLMDADPLSSYQNNENYYKISLQKRNKLTINGLGKYFFNSPLAGAGLAGVDINPWIETTAISFQDFTTQIPIIWSPSGLKPIPARFVNPTEISDIQGGPHSAFDSVKRGWELSFGDGSFYSNNEDLWRLVQILHDTSTQRWYPRGIGNSIFTDQNGNPKAIQGQYNSVDKTFTPFISSGIPMIPKHWNGFWVIITVAGVDKHYYISENDSIKFTLIDKLALTLPSSGIYNFRLEYILVRFALEDLATVQEYFTQFLQGGSWGEYGTTLKQRANTLAHELKGYSIKLLEAIDPEEAV